MNDNFKIIIDIKKTNIYILKILDNYPKVEYVLKNSIENKLTLLLENTYRANTIKENRILYQKEILINIKMIDYYLYLSYIKKIINKNLYESTSKYLLNITKMIYGWINEKSK